MTNSLETKLIFNKFQTEFKDEFNRFSMTKTNIVNFKKLQVFIIKCLFCISLIFQNDEFLRNDKETCMFELT